MAIQWSLENRRIVTEKIQHYWPSMAEETVTEYVDELSRFPVEVVLAALKRFWRAAKTGFSPPMGSLVEIIREEVAKEKEANDANEEIEVNMKMTWAQYCELKKRTDPEYYRVKILPLLGKGSPIPFGGK